MRPVNSRPPPPPPPATHPRVLIEEVLVVAVWSGPPVDQALGAGIQARPRAKPLPPLLRDLGQHVETCPRILPAFGVMGCGSHHGVGPSFLPDRSRPMGFADGLRPEVGGVAANFVQRKQRAVAVERRVFQTFGLHGRGVLLKLHSKAQPALPRQLDLPGLPLRPQVFPDEEEDRRVQRRVPANRRFDRPVEGGPVLLSLIPLCDVSAVRRQRPPRLRAALPASCPM